MALWQWTKGSVIVFTNNDTRAMSARRDGFDVQVVPRRTRVFKTC